jgi:iron(III) transport system permease protein
MNPALEEAARISGAGQWRVLRDITLPLMLPGITSSALLIFMAILANFGIPAVIGFPRRYFVFTNEIYLTILNFDRPNNLQIAAAQSMLLVVFALLTLLMQRVVLGRRQYAVLTGKQDQQSRLSLGLWKAPALFGIALLIVAAVIAPLLAIFAQSITPAPGVPLTPASASLRHYQEMVTIPKIGRALLNSLLLSVSAATIIVFMGVIIAYLSVRLKLRGTQTLNGLVLLPYAIPGTVVALAMILAFLRPLPLINVSLYNTIWLLLIAYIARFLTFGVQAASAAMQQIHPSLEEAARISGADLVQTFRDILAPLIRSGLLAGWFLAFMPALTELTLSVLLFSVGNETIGQVIFGLHQEGKFNLTAAIAFVTTVSVILLHIIIVRVTGGRAINSP